MQSLNFSNRIELLRILEVLMKHLVKCFENELIITRVPFQALQVEVLLQFPHFDFLHLEYNTEISSDTYLMDFYELANNEN